jgi:RNA polymerase sigma factor (sigma-70 family)
VTETEEMGTEQLSLDRLTEAHNKFLRFLSARVGDAATAEDILQSAYVKAIEHGSELRDEESTVAWFYRILRNAVTDHYRRGATRAKALEAFGAEAVESYEPEFQAEACACINEVIRDLKPEYRAAIEQVDLAGESIEALARSQGTTANNASVRLHRARKSVAKNLTAVCGGCAEHKCVDCTCKKH